MSAPELLACPWCGPMNGHYGFTIGRFGTRLTCFCCDSHGPLAATRDEAIAAWNVRATPTPDPRTAALVEAVAKGPILGEDMRCWIDSRMKEARAALAAWEA